MIDYANKYNKYLISCGITCGRAPSNSLMSEKLREVSVEPVHDVFVDLIRELVKCDVIQGRIISVDSTGLKA